MQGRPNSSTQRKRWVSSSNFGTEAIEGGPSHWLHVIAVRRSKSVLLFVEKAHQLLTIVSIHYFVMFHAAPFLSFRNFSRSVHHTQQTSY